MITTTKEKIAVMQAYDNGKRVQVKCGDGMWIDAPVPNWNWMDCNYRIKSEEPKLTYRPYENTDEMIDDFKERFDVDNPSYTRPFIWLKGKYSRHDFLISIFGDAEVFFNNDVRHELKQVFKDFEYLDGTPCGKLVEE